MDRDHILSLLRAHEIQLRASGVKQLSLFGSVARREANPDSDVDIAVRLADTFSTGGLDYFWQLDLLRQKLSQVVGYTVDIVHEPTRKRRFQQEINQDRLIAF